MQKADEMLDLDHQQGRTSWTRASWVGVVALVCALLAVTLLGTGVAQALVERLLPTGSQTVVLKVQFRSGGKSSFSGTFAGRPLQGTFERTDPAIAKKLCPTNDSVENRGTNFTYGGKYNGRSYSFSGCVKVSAVLSKFSYRMTGKIGSVPMSGNTVGLSLKGTTLTLPFKGKVGNQVVTGTATLRDSANGPNAAASLVAHLKIGT
jgi:hypothetical protein